MNNNYPKFIDKNLNKEDIILFLETIAFLHDIGKISSSFIISKASDSSNEDIHAYLPLRDDIPDLLLNQYDFKFTKVNSTMKFIPFSLICAHHGCNQCKQECQIKGNNPFLTLLRRADQKSSEEEKGLLFDIYRQPASLTFISTPFGKEKQIFLQKTDELRAKLWQLLKHAFFTSKFSSLRRRVRKICKPFFLKYPSETRRPANDISLWDHSFSVSTYYKIALYEMIKYNKNPYSYSNIPTLYLKIKYGNGSLKKYIEEVEASGNFIFSMFPYDLYVISKSFADDRDKMDKIIKNTEYELSDNLVDIIPDSSDSLFEELRNTNLNLAFDFKAIVKNISDLTFTHPLDDNNVNNAARICSFLIGLNKNREFTVIKNKINSLNKHLVNLKKGKNSTKIIEYYRKARTLINLKKELNLLNELKLKLDFEEFNENNLSISRHFNYNFSVIEVFKKWKEGKSKLPLKIFYLYYLFRRKYSLALTISLHREILKLIMIINRKFTKKFNEAGKVIFPYLITNSTFDINKLDIITRTIKNYCYKYFDLIPFIINEKNIQKFFKNNKKIYRVKKIKKLKYHLHLYLNDKINIFFPLLLGNNEVDLFRLYREAGNNIIKHLTDLVEGSEVHLNVDNID